MQRFDRDHFSTSIEHTFQQLYYFVLTIIYIHILFLSFFLIEILAQIAQFMINVMRDAKTYYRNIESIIDFFW